VSAIVATDAVVLRSIKFQESSRIVTFYTERFGRLAGIVKGARKSPGRYGSSLQPMAQVSLVVYRKPGRDVQTVSQCDLTFAYRRIPTDLDRMAVGLQMVELVTMAARHEEENPELYALLSGSLKDLDGETDPGWTGLYRFELGLAGILGFRTDFSACANCRRPEDGSWLPASGMTRIDVERGGPLCPRCDSSGARGSLMSATALRLLRTLAAGGGPPAGAGSGHAGERDERIDTFLFEYFSFHMPGFRKLKSGDVFDRVATAPVARHP
jgi:DNA repair protein RecO (recombination protein O)